VSASPIIAILGQGSIGRRHAALFAAEGCEVLAWDPAPEAETAPGVERVASPEEALARAAAAVIASPSSRHLDQARWALDRGCHVLVEKPLSTSADGVSGLIATARSAGLVLAVAMNLRFHPGPATVRRIVRSGEVGRPLLAHVTFGSFLPDWRPNVDYRRSYSARAELGGGIALDAIHEVDYAAWTLGEADEVSAWLGRVSDLELDVEDAALFIVRHTGGAVSTIALDYLDRRYRRGCRVVGSEGSVEWSWADEHVRVLTGGAERALAAPSDVASSYREQARDFLAAVKRGALRPEVSPLAAASEALHAVRVVDAARVASAEGRRVALTSPSSAAT
jgi:predicted dehydrogenase